MGACLSGLLRLVRGERRVYRQRREAVPLDELQPFLLEEEEEDDVEPLYARQPSESGAFERAPKIQDIQARYKSEIDKVMEEQARRDAEIDARLREQEEAVIALEEAAVNAARARKRGGAPQQAPSAASDGARLLSLNDDGDDFEAFLESVKRSALGSPNGGASAPSTSAAGRAPAASSTAWDLDRDSDTDLPPELEAAMEAVHSASRH